MRKAYVIAPYRSAVASFQGSLKSLKAGEIGAQIVKAVLERSGVAPEQVEQVFFGNVLTAGQGQNPARQVAIGAGIPYEVPAMTVGKVCGSGMTAISLAASLVRAGENDCVLVGGVESMSNAPYYMPALRTGARMGNSAAVDGMIQDGLWDVFNDYHMGITAENVAEQYGITRAQQDEFALASQQKASQAQKEGRFAEEIIALSVPQRKGDPIVFDQDEHIRPDATLDSMAKLRPAFKKDGTVTAANASGINDGAAAMLIVSEEFCQKHGLTPFAEYVGGASAGCDPAVMGIGPVPTVKKLLEKTGVASDQVELWEVNEAFASQSIAVLRDLGLAAERVNVNGGAIALGHPIGASGARIVVTLLHEMKRRGAKLGGATLCIGGGMGEASLFRLV